MNGFICNKCFATAYRGKKPFCLTQCGHIYCQGCIQQASKQCPQCQKVDNFSVELQQPSLSQVENFFVPLKESLESFYTIYGFQNNQMKIIVQRFLEIDKKYELLKSHYYNLSQNMKLFREKYNKLKLMNIELQKKLMSYEIHNRTLNSSNVFSTPINSLNKKSKTRHTASSYILSCGTNMTSTCVMLDGFRIPDSQSAKLYHSREISDTNASYTFRH
ncbi:uncharacterized protein LOC116426206 [Nomia melanderi]|uniref:uncharacterized protein LOC116426206 n=1 Tax=Nomia melanderi TaxID=2448451 RepID=UPI0013046F13|nr:probable E3 SUMO-protein ligase RNF212 [Nomia melanderi]